MHKPCVSEGPGGEASAAYVLHVHIVKKKYVGEESIRMYIYLYIWL